MSNTWKWYGQGLAKMMTGDLDVDASGWKIALCASGYSPDASAHDAWADASAYDITASGYTASGKAVTCSAVVDGSGVELRVDAGTTVTWSSFTGSAGHAILYKDTGTPATSYLAMYMTFGDGSPANVAANGGDFSIDMTAADGAVGVIDYIP